MAGDRHHILPRFLLKGFASRTEGKEIYTWVFRSDGRINEPNIKNASVSKYFYGKKGALCVDNNITEFEGNYGPFLDELRAHKEQVDISDPRTSYLITHLVVRTKNVRYLYRESIGFLIDKIREYFSDFANLKEAVLWTMLNKPEMMEEYIEEGFREHPELKPFENILRPLFPSLFLAFFNTQETENLIFCQLYFENIKNKLPKLLKEGHIKALSQGLTPKPRLEEYQRLKWHIYKTDDSLILGDIGCLFEIKGLKRYKSITFEGDEIINVFLPISDRQMLIGTSYSDIASLDIKLINQEIAKCSTEFFICSKNCPQIGSLISLMGSEAEIVSKEEIKQAVNEIILEYKTK
jgi:hypothetical protein